MDLAFIVSEALKGLRRHVSLMAAVTVCVAVCLTLVGAAFLMSRQVEELKGFWYDKVEVSVFLCGASSETTVCPDGPVSATERDAVRAQLDALEVVDRVYYESQREAFERFSKTYEGSRVLTQVDATSMPETFRVKLVDPTQFPAVASEVAGSAGVETVSDQRKLLAPFFSVVSGLQAAALGLALAQVAIALMLVANTVRAALASRRREVAVMRLVGASKAMVRGPFLVEAAVAGLLGAVVSCLSLVALQQFVLNSVVTSRPGSAVYTSLGEVLLLWPVLLVAGAGVPVLAAVGTLRRHLRT